MGISDVLVFTFCCEQCQAKESVRICEYGDYGNFSWSHGVDVKGFKVQWTGGGKTEPAATATCAACGKPATVESRYSM